MFIVQERDVLLTEIEETETTIRVDQGTGEEKTRKPSNTDMSIEEDETETPEIDVAEDLNLKRERLSTREDHWQIDQVGFQIILQTVSCCLMYQRKTNFKTSSCLHRVNRRSTTSLTVNST